MSHAQPSEPPLSLDTLRQEGAPTLDPVRFRYLEVLSLRLLTAPPAVQRILADKLDAGLAACAERCRQRRQVRPAPAVAQARPAEASPLRQLNLHIQRLNQGQALQGDTPRWGVEPPDPQEMKSLRLFRETWARMAAQDQVDKAVGRAPDNAGPLNSHRLVLRSLGLMRDLSPDYLRRFLSQLDALLWLDQVQQQLAVGEPKATRRGKKDKG